MAPLGRKGTEEATSGPARYRLMLDLERARTAAAMIAKSRASSVIEVADLIAGMYLSNWERLSRYWDEQNHEQVETFLRRICRISPQRWNFWMEFYDAERRRAARPAGFLNWRARLQRKSSETETLRPSADLAAVLKEAQTIAPFRDTQDDRRLPVLTTESVLLCIASAQGSEIARSLMESGLDLPKLDREARNPRPAPAN